eukprot:TRINITY_DN12337_c0_g2_i17.p2 TRINITY_DN12337_c0_g2~~TRINITY_DN12337_c0_g2_i17.p2  ORF type:complete len:254 (+),score=40.23 TRINITY_DN12337_c0_g2_i17:159-920(+)
MNCKFQYCVVLLLVVTIVGNFYFLHTMMQSQQQEIHFQHQARHEDGHVSFGEERVHEHVAVKVSKQLNVEAYSSRFQVLVKLDSRTIYNKEYKEGEDQGRGIHAIVLHSNTGALLSSAIFDTYASDAAFSDFLDQLAEGRILVLTIRDEGTFSLKAEAKAKLAKLGSKQATQLKWRDTWCMVVHVGQPTTLQVSRLLACDARKLASFPLSSCPMVDATFVMSIGAKRSLEKHRYLGQACHGACQYRRPRHGGL